MDAGSLSFSSPPPESILQEARLLNSDLGRHSVKSNFSTRLAGRFYSNGSLERHALRRRSLLGLMDRKRGLERELLLEERRVELLLERLRETEEARQNAYALISTIERGVLQFQTAVRRRQAVTLFRTMRHEYFMRKFVAHAFQCRYRGWKGRAIAESKREYLRQKRREDSLLTIQTFTRGRMQRIHYLDLLAERKRELSNRSATVIQAVMRGKLLRQMYQTEMIRRRDGARNIQRIWRGSIGRVTAKKIRDEMIRELAVEEKPKRIPLHLRKYSTYGSNKNSHDAKRRTSIVTNVSKKREVIARRRNSDVMVNMTDHRRLSSFTIPKSVPDADEPENDSVATTLTSLTNPTVATVTSSKPLIRQRANPASPSSRYPQRVLATDNRRGTTQESCGEVGTRKPTFDRRKNATCGISAPLRKSSLHSRIDSVSKPLTVVRRSSMYSCKESVSKPAIPARKSSMHSCNGAVSKPPIPPLHTSKVSVSKPPIPLRKSSLHSCKESASIRERLESEGVDPATMSDVRNDANHQIEVVELLQISQPPKEESMSVSSQPLANTMLLVNEVIELGIRNVRLSMEDRTTEFVDELR